MKKILLIPEFYSQGGARSYFLRLLEFYHSQNFNVHILLNRSQEDDYILKKIKSYNYTYHIIPSHPSFIKKILRKLPFSLVFDFFITFPFFLRYFPHYIVCSVSSPGLYLGAFLYPARIQYILHTEILNFPKYFTKIKQFLSYFLSQKKIVIVVSEYSKRNVLKYWVKDSKSDQIVVIYNTTQEGLYYQTPLSSEKKTLNILTVGQLVEYKNPEYWLNVAQKIVNLDSKVTFTWVGNGPYKKVLEDRIKDNNIRLAGNISNPSTYYLDCDIYFHPSLFETLGMSVIEALSYGIPCIVSNIGGLPEVIQNGFNGFLIDPLDEESAIGKLLLLLNDPSLRHKMSMSAKEKFESVFSVNMWEENMAKLYQ